MGRLLLYLQVTIIFTSDQKWVMKQSPLNLTSRKLSQMQEIDPLESIVSWTTKMGNKINCKLQTIRPLIGN